MVNSTRSTPNDRSEYPAERGVLLSGSVASEPGSLPAGSPEFVSELYRQLHGLASVQVRCSSDGILQPTALVHEAYLRMASIESADVRSATHFLALAAQAMRWVVRDFARRAATAREGAGQIAAELADEDRGSSQAVSMLPLDEALAKLAKLDPRASRVIQLRFFGGLSLVETALALDVSERTVRNDWCWARSWLFAELSRSSSG